jgi:hypothetical protein
VGVGEGQVGGGGGGGNGQSLRSSNLVNNFCIKFGKNTEREGGGRRVSIA